MRSPLIIDPRSVPIIGVDEHLPALNATHWEPLALAAQLACSQGWVPPLGGDGGVTRGDTELRAAAVLMALVRRPEGLTVLLTQRTAHLKAHAGQISFPGGRLEADDASASAGALREAQEEVGLAPEAVEVLGQLPAYRTVTAFEVTPVLAWVQPPLNLKPDPHEVQDIFEVPLDFLMNPAHHRRHCAVLQDRTRQFLSMPWRGRGLSGEEREFFIWGATAAMLRNLYHLLARPLSSRA
ncbi:MAG: CoA pyrophosphatase [Betaproteobacteria bacterium]|nr:CoA pyrophosphatase [Betaproteobacteria bacterium]